jgi:hypothetical protein
MTYPTVFANLAAGNQPASLIDTMFNIAGQQGNLPCTAGGGASSITLTPNANYYVPTAYTDMQLASFQAAATSTGAVTIAIGGLASVRLYTAALVQANAGDVTSGNPYVIQYRSFLNSGSGGFFILNASTPSVAQPILADYSNKTIANNVSTPASQVDVAMDWVVVQNGSGGTTRLGGVAFTINFATTGVNGLDVGSVAANKIYSLWVIYNGSTIAGVASTALPPTLPTLPIGYTYFAYVGDAITDGSSNIYRFKQQGNAWHFIVGTGLTGLPAVITGATGTYVTATGSVYASITLRGGTGTPPSNNFVPPFASEGYFVLTNVYKNGTTANAQMAPNTNYNSVAGTVGNNPWAFIGSGSGQNHAVVMPFEGTTGSLTIGFTADNTGAALLLGGWKYTK